MTPFNTTALRRAYRRLLAIPARRRWGGGLLLAGMAVVAGRTCGAGPAGMMQCVLISTLGIVTLTDLAWRRIPNWVIVPALAWSLALAALGGILPAAVAGGVTCFAAMLGLHLLFRGGEGDVKLFAVIGATLGMSAGLETLLAGYLIAAAFAVTLIFGRILIRSRRPALAGHLPMAPFFSVAALAITHGS